MSGIYVEVEPVAPTTKANAVRNACNRVIVSVSHHKGKGVVASAYPAELRPDGILSTLITNGEYQLLEPAKRLNRKLVEYWEGIAQTHVDIRVGGDVVWELVLKVCQKNGLKPKARVASAEASTD